MKTSARDVLDLLVTNGDKDRIEQAILDFDVSFADPAIRESQELSDFVEGVMKITPKLEASYMHVFNLLRWHWEEIQPAQRTSLRNFVDKKIDETNDLGAIQSMADFLEKCI